MKHNTIWISFIIIVMAFSLLTDGHFGYTKKHQHLWLKDHKSCAGKLQSPIALSSARSLPLPLPALETIGYHNFLKNPVNLKNDGHSVILTINKDQTESLIPFNPYIFGAMLTSGQNYDFEALHFHWGRKNNRGSEHILNGVRFPMEMHIIHRNKNYPNMEVALNNSDGLAVLGIFFQLQEEHNPRLFPILEVLPDVRWSDSQASKNVLFSLSSLMPLNTEIFYTYKGSLTTPPCNEAVTWIIFPTSVPISFKQLNKFRLLSSGEGLLADNYRHLQGVGLRKVYVRRMDLPLVRKKEILETNITNLSWYWQ